MKSKLMIIVLSVSSLTLPAQAVLMPSAGKRNAYVFKKSYEDAKKSRDISKQAFNNSGASSKITKAAK